MQWAVLPGPLPQKFYLLDSKNIWSICVEYAILAVSAIWPAGR